MAISGAIAYRAADDAHARWDTAVVQPRSFSHDDEIAHFYVCSWPIVLIRRESSDDSNRCKVDIDIAAMDGGDELQAVRSTDHLLPSRSVLFVRLVL